MVTGTITGADAGAVVDATPGTINVNVGGKATSFAISATTTYTQLATAINNANIGVTANAGATTFSLTDNQNRGDISVTAGSGDGANALISLGTPVAGGTAGTAVSQFQNATVTNLNTLQGSATNISGGNVLGSVGSNQLVVSAGNNSYTFTTTQNETVGQLISNINSSGDGLQAGINGTGQFTLTDTQGNGNIAVNVGNSDATVVSALFGGTAASNMSNPTVSAANRLSVFLSDSSSQGTSTIGVDLLQLDAGHLGGSSGIANNDLLTTSDAQAALTAINQGISNIAAFRGNIGAGVNQLAAASSVMSSQATNLTTAESGISDADIGKTVANMTKYTTCSRPASQPCNRQTRLLRPF